MTDNTSPEEDARQLDLQKWDELIHKGRVTGLSKEEVYTLSAIARLFGFPGVRNVGEYDKYRTKLDMICAALRRVGSPTLLGQICDEVAGANTRFSRRGLWDGAIIAVENKKLINVSGQGTNRVVALPEWHLPSRKK